MNDNDISPAFPIPPFQGPNAIIWGSNGLNKRELFAAMAMQGALASPTRHGSPQEYADFAVVCADTLLRELAK